MYRRPTDQMVIEEFILPFEGKLSANNRWVKLSKIIPWEQIEKDYANLFPSGTGNVAKPLRMALGALIIKERCGFTDRETVEQITENPYLQYFIGLEKYQIEPPFDPSLMVFFRKRLDHKIIKKINKLICDSEKPKEPKDKDPGNPSDPDSFEVYKPDKNKGKLLLDATCAPADIRYPTDLSLLNEAREKTEKIIDTLYNQELNLSKKPRTYRKRARKEYLKIAKQRKPHQKAIRKAIGKQLGYLRRNLGTIDFLLTLDGHGDLSSRQYEELKTIHILVDQQLKMYQTKTHKIDHRIVSISQPHIRPIVRGKARSETEFGAKVSISMVDGYASIDRLSWEPFSESLGLIQSVEEYKQNNGYYPESVHVDKIYRTRDNLAFCRKHGIRLSGPPLGRPQLDNSQEKKISRQDMRERNAVEGGFGVCKRRYGLARIMARLKDTAESVISLQFLVMNLERRLRLLYCHFICVIFETLNKDICPPKT
ncbi:MAG TPA: IS5 family transposase, partial [Bacteroidales bacterium]|nr:IS5 family transposase [Bacteroidales bacterium]